MHCFARGDFWLDNSMVTDIEFLKLKEMIYIFYDFYAIPRERKYFQLSIVVKTFNCSDFIGVCFKWKYIKKVIWDWENTPNTQFFEANSDLF